MNFKNFKNSNFGNISLYHRTLLKLSNELGKYVDWPTWGGCQWFNPFRLSIDPATWEGSNEPAEAPQNFCLDRRPSGNPSVISLKDGQGEEKKKKKWKEVWQVQLATAHLRQSNYENCTVTI